METFSDLSHLDKNYWETRWQNKKTGWDIGFSSPAIVEYMLQYQNKDAKILIPGCGNAYEVESLYNLGFKNITVVDISATAVEILKEKYKDTEGVKVICEDFFNHKGNYDLIIEQTFFCAISPLLRTQYAQKMHSLLNENGGIIGVLFNKVFEKNGPPFGGTVSEYQTLFSENFDIQKMEECYNSIEPRKGSEVFINLKKKKVI
ncbi:methyltransferase domain-containing protein [Chryseobacterium gotjawalense]|uniref:Methyltransferase domain-containing protein n=1 Tax=Chryseobacterium gotjawalense TaxID=3042315 RepID=A0ABY8RAC4_9FLAO|nr:methyltransferase domain-containing protein [Chryseobacterium sp. wdc7]WHF50644.1 methyltransferase domain-containing protein [Chryseobacterium sp. wdc7]